MKAHAAAQRGRGEAALLLNALVCHPALPAAFVRRSALRGAGKFYTAVDVQKMRATDTPRLRARVTGGDLRDLGVGDLVLVSRRGIRQTFSAPIENELCRIGVVVVWVKGR